MGRLAGAAGTVGAAGTAGAAQPTGAAQVAGAGEAAQAAGAAGAVQRRLLELADLLAAGPAAVLSGAGLSTESGIPDYRGPSGQLRARLPMTVQEFTSQPAARRRYWARSQLGWQRVAGARPNAGHYAVAELQRLGALGGIVTQNVDGLHQAAGARRVVELHGALARVRCLDCQATSTRQALDARLRAANPGWRPEATGTNPDGDAGLAEAALAGFQVVGCADCGGVLKPDVVFFGENVPRDRVAACFELVEQAPALLVLGSSLQVMSGYRFVLRAARRGVPVGILTRGVTRGDRLAAVKLDAPLGVALPALAALVAGRPA